MRLPLYIIFEKHLLRRFPAYAVKMRAAIVVSLFLLVALADARPQQATWEDGRTLTDNNVQKLARQSPIEQGTTQNNGIQDSDTRGRMMASHGAQGMLDPRVQMMMQAAQLEQLRHQAAQGQTGQQPPVQTPTNQQSDSNGQSGMPQPFGNGQQTGSGIPSMMRTQHPSGGEQRMGAGMPRMMFPSVMPPVSGKNITDGHVPAGPTQMEMMLMQQQQMMMLAELARRQQRQQVSGGNDRPHSREEMEQLMALQNPSREQFRRIVMQQQQQAIMAQQAAMGAGLSPSQVGNNAGVPSSASPTSFPMPMGMSAHGMPPQFTDPRMQMGSPNVDPRISGQRMSAQRMQQMSPDTATTQTPSVSPEAVPERESVSSFLQRIRARGMMPNSMMRDPSVQASDPRMQQLSTLQDPSFSDSSIVQEPMMGDPRIQQQAMMQDPRIQQQAMMQDPRMQSAMMQDPRMQSAMMQDPRMQSAMMQDPRIQQQAMMQDPRMQSAIVQDSRIQSEMMQDPRIQQQAMMQDPRIQSEMMQDPRIQQQAMMQDPRMQQSAMMQDPRIQQQAMMQDPRIQSAMMQDPRMQQQAMMQDPRIQQSAMMQDPSLSSTLSKDARPNDNQRNPTMAPLTGHDITGMNSIMGSQKEPVASVSLPSMQHVMELESRLQVARAEILRSFYSDLLKYRDFSQQVQAQLSAKLVMLHQIETQLATPMRYALATQSTTPRLNLPVMGPSSHPSMIVTKLREGNTGNNPGKPTEAAEE